MTELLQSTTTIQPQKATNGWMDWKILMDPPFSVSAGLPQTVKNLPKTQSFSGLSRWRREKGTRAAGMGQVTG